MTNKGRNRPLFSRYCEKPFRKSQVAYLNAKTKRKNERDNLARAKKRFAFKFRSWITLVERVFKALFSLKAHTQKTPKTTYCLSCNKVFSIVSLVVMVLELAW